jgi:L-ascorbate metabolism protein UlaG (beta-lactamase superfamily)
MGLHPDTFNWAPDKRLSSSAGRWITIRWLGTAGYEIVCDGVTLLIDPYLSRVSLRSFLFSVISPDEAAIARAIPKADGIVVGHSHFDHLMDVPAIARQTGARVWGSASTANVLRASGVDESQIVECEGGDQFEVGPFRIQLVPSEHSRFGLRKTVPFAGEIPCTCDIPMRGRDYKCGATFGISIQVDDVTLYHCGSANLVDDAISDSDVDVLFLCIAARFATDRFIPRVLGKLEPRMVLPTHYDNFFRASSRELKLLPRIAFGRFVDEVTAFDKQIEIATLPINGVMAVKA